MNALRPLLLPYWEALRGLATPIQLMKFTLTYDDDLPSTGNKSRPAQVSRIRNVFHDQFDDLWDSHVVLRQLARTARDPFKVDLGSIGEEYELPDFREPVLAPRSGEVDLCAPIKASANSDYAYIPIVRKSLCLACGLEITFLRQEDPGSLVLQGGDIDGRMKTLFDALRIPSDQEEEAAGEIPTANPLYCLLESDSLISDLSIKTGRLLGRRAKKVHHVVLTIDVTIKVLRVIDQNICLVGY
jgi:hypothetical protein